MISYDPRLPLPPDDEYLKRLNFQLTTALREIMQRVDLMSYGNLAGTRGTALVIPATGTAAVGDVITKANPVEAGAAASKYIIMGWVCVTAGSPGTWREMRVLTGN